MGPISWESLRPRPCRDVSTVSIRPLIGPIFLPEENHQVASIQWRAPTVWHEPTFVFQSQRTAQLITSLQRIREREADSRLVLEIHEAGVTQLDRMRDLRKALADLQIGLAYDDFGSGQARLIEMVEVPPDYLKFDIGLIRDIHLSSAERQGMLANLVQMANNLGIATLAEGIETREEHESCVQLGFDYAQGFFYGRPALPSTFLEL